NSYKVALKILDRMRLDAQAQRLLSREINSMEALQHPNIIRLYEVVETPSRLYLVLEYAGGGDLHNRICSEGKLCDNTSKVTFAQVLSAIKYMHNLSIIHRDLKAENVLFTTTGAVKVADFGFSTRVSNRNLALDTFCGSPPLRGPGALQGRVLPGPPRGRVGHGGAAFLHGDGHHAVSRRNYGEAATLHHRGQLHSAPLGARPLPEAHPGHPEAGPR
uniref:non-specific serine/threonine protein kinase n=1 Tax=Oryzias sinensis TaxID=183150 RepID=A0A8C7YQV4_9TELE